MRNKINVDKINWKKGNGLTPAIVQDSKTSRVLMLGYFNKKSLIKTIKTKKVWFYSRTKKRLWQKGESSNNYLEVKNIFVDCDNDAILVKVIPNGPTCHTKAASCFKNQQQDSDFDITNLYATILNRKITLPKNSYTAKLLKAGLNKINKKIIEEATEVIMASSSESKQRLAEEVCDLLYHLLVLLAFKNIGLNKINNEFKKRNNLKNSSKC